MNICGEVSEQELIDLYARCKGFIRTALDEDFDLTPVEAMASEKPFVAVNEGWFRETFTEKMGLFINSDLHRTVETVKFTYSKHDSYRNACLEQAKRFDLSIFSKKMKNVVNNDR